MKLVSIDRLSVLSLHYYQYSLDYFLDSMERLGLKTVELLGGHQDMWLDDKSFQDPAPIRKKLADHHLDCKIITPQNCRFGYQYGVKEPELREKTFGFFANGLRLGAALGAKYMEANAGWGYWNEDPEEGIKRCADMMQRLCRVAEEEDMIIVSESLRPQESRTGATLAQMKKIFDLVDHPRYKAMIDLTAMSVSGETIQDWFDVFGAENIAHAHFQDCNPMGHYIWGGGTRNLREDLECMEKNGYTGYYTQELTIADYYLNPFPYDKQNLMNLRQYFK